MATYSLVLTGSPSVTLPISSANIRMRDDSKTSYVSVVVPNLTKWASDIAARSAGNMVLTMHDNGVDTQLFTCPLLRITEQEGSSNSSVTLSGDYTISNPAPAPHTIQKVSYKTTSASGSFSFRTPVAFIQPQDTVIIDEISRTVDTVSLTLSDSNQMQITCV